MNGPPFKTRSANTETFRAIMEEGYQYVAKIFDKERNYPLYRVMKSLDDNPIKEELERGRYGRDDLEKIEVYRIPKLVKVKELDLDSICDSSE